MILLMCMFYDNSRYDWTDSMRTRYRPWMSGVRAKHYLHRRIISDPRTAIYRIYIYNHAEPLSVLTIAWNIFICSSAIFLTRGA